MTRDTQDDDIDHRIGLRLRDLREARGMSMMELGKLAGGITYQQIQKYETGANRISVSRLWRIGTALQVSVSYFFEIETDGIDAQITITSQQLDRIEPEVRQPLLSLINLLSR